MKILAVLLNPTIDEIYKINNFKVGGTYMVHESIIYPVGKAISFSLAIQELSLEKNEIKVIACIGKDDIPLYTNFLQKKLIDFQFISVNGKTRSNKTINDPINGTTTHMREGGFDLSEGNLNDLRNVLNSNIEEGDIIVFSGSIPRGTNDNIYLELIEMSKQQGAITCLDTSGNALIKGIKALPSILKPNLVELSQILQIPGIKEINLSDIKDACNVIIGHAKKLLNEDIEIILITLGDKGAICLTESARHHGNVQVHGVIDTVGSGDSFLAGFIFSYLKKENMLQCFKHAIASGAANTLISGPGIFKKESVERILKEVRILELD